MNKAEMGSYIAARRQDLGLRQEDVAQMAGVTAKTLYTIESGKGNPSFDSLGKLLDVLGLTVNLTIKMKADERSRL